MCCLSTIFLVLVSRIGILIWWLANPQARDLAFSSWSLPGLAIASWVWTLVGAIFLPWTTLAYLLLFQGGIVGYEWLVLIAAFLVDMAGHSGSYRHRRRVRWSRYLRF